MTRKAKVTPPTPGGTPRTTEQNAQSLKVSVRSFYDIQRIRMQIAGRGKRKAKGAEIQLHPDDLHMLNIRAMELERAEDAAAKDVDEALQRIPFYRDVLCDHDKYRGLGPAMAGVILAEFDIHRADTPSKLWAFAGLAPVACKRCAECHRIVEEMPEGYRHAKHQQTKSNDVPITCSGDKNPAAIRAYESGRAMKPTKGEKLSYSAFLRSKLIGVLGPNLLKSNSPWRKAYDDYKHRMISKGWGICDGHRHNAAIRYMVKMLLLDIWVHWREAEGLPTRAPYAEEFLNHKHVGGTIRNTGS